MFDMKSKYLMDPIVKKCQFGYDVSSLVGQNRHYGSHQFFINIFGNNGGFPIWPVTPCGI